MDAASSLSQEDRMASPSDDKLPSYSSTTITATCHCTGINILLPSPPTSITECNCSICRRYGAIWAYYRHKDVLVTAEAGHSSVKYIRSDPGSAGDAEFQFCSKCGCMTHLTSVSEENPERSMAVNVRMVDPEVWTGVERKKVAA